MDSVPYLKKQYSKYINNTQIYQVTSVQHKLQSQCFETRINKNTRISTSIITMYLDFIQRKKWIIVQKRF
jgi:hypothetical protein